jgi:transposase
MQAMGESYRKIVAEFNTTPSTVYAIVKRFKSEQTVQIKPRKGRPAKLSKAERKYIILLLERDRDITWKALAADIGV